MWNIDEKKYSDMVMCIIYVVTTDTVHNLYSQCINIEAQ